MAYRDLATRMNFKGFKLVTAARTYMKNVLAKPCLYMDDDDYGCVSVLMTEHPDYCPCWELSWMKHEYSNGRKEKPRQYRVKTKCGKCGEGERSFSYRNIGRKAREVERDSRRIAYREALREETFGVRNESWQHVHHAGNMSFNTLVEEFEKLFGIPNFRSTGKSHILCEPHLSQWRKFHHENNSGLLSMPADDHMREHRSSQ